MLQLQRQQQQQQLAPRRLGLLVLVEWPSPWRLQTEQQRRL
jgi:hypothetical protein